MAHWVLFGRVLLFDEDHEYLGPRHWLIGIFNSKEEAEARKYECEHDKEPFLDSEGFTESIGSPPDDALQWRNLYYYIKEVTEIPTFIELV